MQTNWHTKTQSVNLHPRHLLVTTCAINHFSFRLIAPIRRSSTSGARLPTHFVNRMGVRFRRTRMNPEEQNKALDAWQTSARYWDKYRVLIAQMFAPLTSGLVEEARIGIGQKVLDIGGGSGEPSLTISGIVGPAGSVMYTDPVAGMVER